MKKNFILSLLLAAMSYSVSFGQQSPITVKKSTTRHGPEKGSLIIIGGGGSTPKIWAKFTELA
ncbi:MAG TPA: peptidase S51, partial [Mucilaginibacter sp.]